MNELDSLIHCTNSSGNVNPSSIFFMAPLGSAIISWLSTHEIYDYKVEVSNFVSDPNSNTFLGGGGVKVGN